MITVIIIIIKTMIIKINDNNNNNNNKLIRKSISRRDYPLPEGWKKSLPKEDHIWVSKALFKQSSMKDKVELDMSKVNKLWWYPPQLLLRVHQRPYYGCQENYSKCCCIVHMMIVSSTLLPVQACTLMLDRCLTWMASTPWQPSILSVGSARGKLLAGVRVSLIS